MIPRIRLFHVQQGHAHLPDSPHAARKPAVRNLANSTVRIRVLGPIQTIQTGTKRCEEAGTDANGMVITQVVSPYYLTDLKTVALYRRTMLKHSPNSKANFVSLEGFVDAMVVEGMKRAGKELTREGLIRGIESLHDWDAGLGPDLRLDYSVKDQKGFDHVIPTVVRGARVVPFTDWTIVPAK